MASSQPRLLTELLRASPRLNRSFYEILLKGSGNPGRHRDPTELAPTAGSGVPTPQPAFAGARSRAARAAHPGLPAPLQAAGGVGQLLPGAAGAATRSLVTEAIAEVTPAGIRTAGGREHLVDLIVMATGFQAHNYMRPMDLRGRDGISIDDAWAKGPRAYRMTAIPGFPNLFTVLGPNSPVGFDLSPVLGRRVPAPAHGLAARGPPPEATGRRHRAWTSLTSDSGPCSPGRRRAGRWRSSSPC